MAWLVVYTKSQKETLAHDHLERQGFLTYPLCLEKKLNVNQKLRLRPYPSSPVISLFKQMK